MYRVLINQKEIQFLLPKEEVIHLLSERHRMGLSLNQILVKRENVGLYYSVVRYWGKWLTGLKRLGIAEKKYRHWTKEMVIEAVKQRYQSGLPLANRAILSDDPSLIVQIRKFFGNKKRMYHACGIPLKEISKDYVLEILKQQSQKPGGLKSLELRRMKIHGPMLKHFGSKTNAYKAIGLSDNEIRKIKLHSNKWTEETVVKIIQELKFKGYTLSGGFINKTNPSLYRAARTHFGSWAGALQYAGIDCQTPKICRKHTKWNREKILEMLDSLLKRYGNKNQIPTKEKFRYYWLCRKYFGSSKEAWTAVSRMVMNEPQIAFVQGLAENRKYPKESFIMKN